MSHLRKVTKLETNLRVSLLFRLYSGSYMSHYYNQEIQKNKNLKFDLLLLLYIIHYVKYTTSVVAQ